MCTSGAQRGNAMYKILYIHREVSFLLAQVPVRKSRNDRGRRIVSNCLGVFFSQQRFLSALRPFIDFWRYCRLPPFFSSPPFPIETFKCIFYFNGQCAAAKQSERSGESTRQRPNRPRTENNVLTLPTDLTTRLTRISVMVAFFF